MNALAIRTTSTNCLTTRLAGIALGVLGVTACATGPAIPFPDAFDEEAISAEVRLNGPHPVADDAVTSPIMRRGAYVGQAGVLLARSFHVDPINRPVSNFLSLSSYALKSATGLLQRTAIGTVQFPALEATPIPELAGAAPMDLEAWEADLDRITGSRQTRGTIDFLIDGEAYFERMLEAVENASKSIDVRTYIFDNDDFALEVADVLKAKSKEADIRVLVDGLGTMVAMQADPDSLPDGLRVPLSIERYIENGSSVRFRSRANPWLTGDHTKTTIIDRKIAFVGGMNIGREYRHEWHDMMMEVTGPVVDELQFDMDKAWARASLFGDLANLATFFGGKRQDAGNRGFPIRVLYTRNHDSQIYRAQLAAIRRSQSYILIENAYFSDDATLYELARARRRGVDVHVILPEQGNHGSHDASNRVAINRMLDNGIRVYLYPGMTHVKAAVIDGWASVGSANFDKLSLQVNRELNLATSHQPAVEELIAKLFMPDLARSTEVAREFNLSLQTRIMEIVADEIM